jgi:hypothetical protein
MDVGNRYLSSIVLILLVFIATACGDDPKTPPEIPVDDTDLLGTVTDADVMNSPCLAAQDYFNQKVKPSFVMPTEDVLAKNFETFTESLQGSTTLQDINSKCAKDDSLCKINKLLGEDTVLVEMF